MEYRELGQTGEKVSVISFGTAPLGGLFGAVAPDQGIRTVQLAIDKGINFFDTAPFYGNAETLLGQALTGKRDQVLLGTKVGRYGRTEFDFSKKRTMESVEQSLQLLNTDYVDVVQAHDIEYVQLDQVFEETYDALVTLQRQGKCRFIGMTGYPLKTLRRAIESCQLDVLLSYAHYNLFNTTLDSELLPIASANGVGLFNAAAVALGLLTRQGPQPTHPAPGPLKDACRTAGDLCETRGVDISHLAMQFCLAHPTLTTTVVGTSKPEKLEQNLASLNDPLDAQLLADVQAILHPVQDTNWVTGLPENN